MENEKYLIYCTLSKEKLIDKVKQTTYNMTPINQSYRKVFLADYDDSNIKISYANGVAGGVKEAFCAQIREDNSGVILDGRFEILSFIKIEAKIILLIIIAITIWFYIDSAIMGLFLSVFILFPTILVYKNLKKICISDDYRVKILSYIEKELCVKHINLIYDAHGMTSKRLDWYYVNKNKLGNILSARMEVDKEIRNYNLIFLDDSGNSMVIMSEVLSRYEEDDVREVFDVLKDAGFNVTEDFVRNNATFTIKSDVR